MTCALDFSFAVLLLLTLSIFLYAHTNFFTLTCKPREKSAKIYLKQKKIVLVLQPKRIFLCNKEKYIWFKCLLPYFKDPLLKSKGIVLWLKYDSLNCKYFFPSVVKLIQFSLSVGYRWLTPYHTASYTWASN